MNVIEQPIYLWRSVAGHPPIGARITWGTEHECWEWMGHRTTNGYGRVTINGKSHPVHRVTYTYFRGDIPAGLEIDHLCRNRACVNPNHLEPVTRLENMRRAAAVITHCPKGHELSPANLTAYGLKRGVRECRECHRQRSDARNKRLAPLLAHPPQPKTHCPQGHELTPENTYVQPRGYRECRTCRAERGAKRRAAK